MTRDEIRALTYDEVIRLCPPPRPLTPNQIDLAGAWPMWEAACRLKRGYSMHMSHGRCVIVETFSNGKGGLSEWIVVPTGAPGDAIRRAWLLAQI